MILSSMMQYWPFGFVETQKALWELLASRQLDWRSNEDRQRHEAAISNDMEVWYREGNIGIECNPPRPQDGFCLILGGPGSMDPEAPVVGACEMQLARAFPDKFCDGFNRCHERAIAAILESLGS